MTMTLDGTNGVTFFDTSLQGAAASPFGLKNRLINGAMVIDQRNAGAAVTVNSNTAQYPVDRWFGAGTAADGVFTLDQNTTAPTGFINSVVATVTTADANIGATQYYLFNQYIEGYNIADLDWGTANAKTVTLSFWTRSSLTGTFGGVISNSGQNRSYPFTYSISVANTYEYKTITIAGDTSGTWLTDTGIGIRLHFDLGVGSTYRGTAGAWAGATYLGATGATNVIGTLNATFYITGVQLEQNTSATPFERRLIGQELANCQRYYYKIQATAADSPFSMGSVTTTTIADIIVPFPVSMRTDPTALEQSGTAGDYRVRTGITDTVCSSVPTLINKTTTTSQVRFTVASGLTAGNAAIGRSVNATAYLAWSAEL